MRKTITAQDHRDPAIFKRKEQAFLPYATNLSIRNRPRKGALACDACPCQERRTPYGHLFFTGLIEHGLHTPMSTGRLLPAALPGPIDSGPHKNNFLSR